MPTLFLESLLAPDVQDGGTSVSPRRKVLNFVNATVADNPATRATDITLPGAISSWSSVRLATAAALPANTRTVNTITASGNGLLTIDGEAVILADVVLVANEADAENNGVYTVAAVGSGGAPFVLTRHTNFDTAADFPQGLRLYVTEGTANIGAEAVLVTTDAITLNTTELEFAFPAGSGGGSTSSGVAIADAPATITVSQGNRRRVLPSTLSANRTITLGTSGATAGDLITIHFRDNGAFDMPIVNGGPAAGTAYTFAGSADVDAAFRFDGIDWTLWTKESV